MSFWIHNALPASFGFAHFFSSILFFKLLTFVVKLAAFA
jgi:hypothetical protein